MSLASSERLEYIYDTNGKLLLINNNDRIRGDGSLVTRCADPVNFNRVCGPLVSATASPDDNAFTAEVGASSELLSISAAFSRQLRHGASPQDLRHPALVLIMRRHGEASLRVGGMAVPLDVAIVSSDIDFSIRAVEPDGVCAVSYIMLMGVPDLVAQMPRSLMIPEAVHTDGRQTLRAFGERIVEWVSASKHLAECDVLRFSVELTRLIQEQFEHGEWIDPGVGGEYETGMTTGNGRDIISMVQRYLRQHSSDTEVTPVRIARHCAVSVRKLYNAFAMADMSLRATVLSYRLEEARRQLNGRMVKKVTSIAYDAGFRDVSTFYRNFRREFGYSPRNSVVNDMPQEPAAQEHDRRSPKRRNTYSDRPEAVTTSGARPKGFQDSAGENVPLPRDTLFRHRTSVTVGGSPGTADQMRFHHKG